MGKVWVSRPFALSAVFVVGGSSAVRTVLVSTVFRGFAVCPEGDVYVRPVVAVGCAGGSAVYSWSAFVRYVVGSLVEFAFPFWASLG